MRKYILSLLAITILFSCKKDILENNQSATLHFSNDTIILDTAFYSIGTPTKTLTIYNRNDFTVHTNISLELVDGGNFRMNVDGIAGPSHNEIEIPAKDSIFIFLEATLDESTTSNNFILTSNIKFTTGAKKQDVKIVSPGKNANFHLPHPNSFWDGTDNINYNYHSIEGDQIWTNELPHVIYGYVIIEPDASLTIQEGSEIYFHNNSGIFVGNPILINADGTPPQNNGTLIIDGKRDNKVVLQGDRLDAFYTNLLTPAGQWNGIHFVPGSINNSIDYAIIRNGKTAIRADTVSNSHPTVTIKNTIIENMSGIGILGQGAHITVNNTIISKCGLYAVACNIGGTYNFTHCTFANYWNNSSRITPSILLNNYYVGADGNTYTRELNAANFTNCIIEGSLSTEVSFQEQEQEAFNYKFDHCLIKLDPTINTDNTHYENTIFNQSPKFINNTESNFRLKEDSPAINAGNSLTEYTYDIEGNPRNNPPGSRPDIGAYEFIE